MPQYPKSRRFEFSNTEISAFRMFERRNLGVSDSRRRTGVENLGPVGATVFACLARERPAAAAAAAALFDRYLTAI